MIRRNKRNTRRETGVAAVVAAITKYAFSATNKATVKILPLIQCKTN